MSVLAALKRAKDRFPTLRYGQILANAAARHVNVTIDPRDPHSHTVYQAECERAIFYANDEKLASWIEEYK